ncbi:relaxase/mobilization nuclease domain-containing protein [Campylobacter jejuni]
MKKSFSDYWEEIQKIKKASSVIKDNYKRNKVFNSFVNSYSIKHNINNINQTTYSKQAVVKLCSNLSKDGAKRAMDYILNSADTPYLINEKGEEILTEDVIKDWKMDFSNQENAKDAWHLIFSIKENPSEKNLEILKKSVKETMDNNFFGYKYVMAIHTHQNNPHIHIVLNKRNILTKKKIHFNTKDDIKDFWNDVRSNFSMSLSSKGLHYHNQASYEKDLDRKYQKIKSTLYLDDIDTKKDLSDMILNIIRKESKKLENKKSKIDILNNESLELKQKRLDLINLFNQYKKKNNKKYFKLGKELKKLSDDLNKIDLKILSEIKEIQKINEKISLLNKELDKYNYQNIVDTKNLKNFVDFMRKNKLATKSDYDLLEKVKLSILKNDVNLDKSLKNTMEANTILTKLFNGKKESIFKIEKKINNINNYIEILKQSNAEVKEYENYLKILEKNKELLKDYAKNRLDNLKLSISKNKNKIPLNAYIIQEYKKGCEYLNINDDLKLVSVKSNKINYGGFNKSKDNQKIL